MRYAALLRGINVGKSVRVPMKDLKALLEGLGLSDVVTYLNSGNAIFSSESNMSTTDLAQLIEDAVEQAVGQRVPTLVKSGPEVIAIAEAIPCEWKTGDGEQTYIAYLFGDADRADLIPELPIKKEFMDIFYTPGALIWNIKKENYNRSHINKLIGHSSYGQMTTRNANTARKLATLCAAI